MRRKLPNEEQGSPQIHGEVVVEPFTVEILDLIAFERAGIVDEQRQRPDRSARRRDEAEHSLMIGKVCKHRLRLSVEAGNLGA